MKQFWEDRYRSGQFIYGTTPNLYLKEKLDGLNPGKILFPGDGEGRNSVYAVTLGWESTAVDLSDAGEMKATYLAMENGVKIEYAVSDIKDIEYPQDHFEAVALIYVHFPENTRREFHRKLGTYLMSGGKLILEGFNKSHARNQRFNPQAGGPKIAGMLYDLDEIKEDFTDFDFIEAENVTTVLKEGEFHKGKADVVRIYARKR